MAVAVCRKVYITGGGMSPSFLSKTPPKAKKARLVDLADVCKTSTVCVPLRGKTEGKKPLAVSRTKTLFRTRPCDYPRPVIYVDKRRASSLYIGLSFFCFSPDFFCSIEKKRFSRSAASHFWPLFGRRGFSVVEISGSRCSPGDVLVICYFAIYTS